MSNEDLLKTTACPGCQTVGSLKLETKFHINPNTCLSGSQIKFGANKIYMLVCPCGFKEEAK